VATSTTDELDRALDELRAHGQRVTNARRAIIEALIGADRGLTPAELATAIGSAQPDTHLSTVYRNLEALGEAGLVAHVHGDDGSPRYQLTTRVHVQARCDLCGMTIDLPRDIMRSVTRRLREAYDFELDVHHFPLLGRCSACRSAAGTVPHRHNR
jgi:Fur family ferric uptake transcriptional regulator